MMPVAGLGPGFACVRADGAEQGYGRLAGRLLHLDVGLRGAHLSLGRSQVRTAARLACADQFVHRALGGLLRFQVGRLRDVKIPLGR